MQLEANADHPLAHEFQGLLWLWRMFIPSLYVGTVKIQSCPM